MLMWHQQSWPGRWVAVLLWLLGLAGPVFLPAVAAATDPQLLEPGQVVERRLGAGESHTYRLRLGAHQYLYILADQLGVDLEVVLKGPTGEVLAQADGPGGGHALEILAAVTRRPGDHHLLVRAPAAAGSGAYRVSVEELRPARPDDDLRIRAETIYAQGLHQEARGNVESRRTAIGKYQESLSLWRALGDAAAEAFTLNRMGQVHRSLGEIDRAFEAYQEALPLWRQAGDHGGEAATLSNLGVIRRIRGELSAALSHYHEALRLQRQTGDRLGEAETLNNLGRLHSSLGEMDRALGYYEEALPLSRQMGDRKGEGTILLNIGAAHFRLGELARAVDSYLEALAVFEAVGDREAQAHAFRNIGVAYEGLGRMRAALEYQERALETYVQAGNVQGQARAREAVAKLYFDLGELAEARRQRLQALELHRRLGDAVGEAWDLLHLGHIHREDGEWSRSLERLRQALSLALQAGDRRLQAAALEGLGTLDREQGRLEKARTRLQEALTLRRQIGDRAGVAETLASLGEVQRHQGDLEAATEHLEEAVTSSQTVGNPVLQARGLLGLARALRQRGRLLEARSRALDALELIEGLRREVVGPELRSTFLAFKRGHYEFAIDLLMQLHQHHPDRGFEGDALEVSERARARSLLDLLRESGTEIRRGVDPALLQRESEAQQRLNALERRRMDLLAGEHDPVKAARLEGRVQEVLRELRQLQGRIRTRSPGYAALTQPQPLRVSAIQSEVLDSETVLLEFSLGESRSFLWLVTPTSVDGFELPPRQEIEAAVRRAYDLLTTRNRIEPGHSPQQRHRRIAAADAAFRQAATSLGRLLLGPVAERLGDQRLLVVAEGALQYVPLGTLAAPGPDKGSDATAFRPLIVDHELVYLPSASVLAELRRLAATQPPAPKLLAILADPVFQPTDPRVALQRTGEAEASASRLPSGVPAAPQLPELAVASLPRLRFSRSEAHGIASLAPQHQVLQALDFQASREMVVSGALSQYRLLHLATHGIVDTEHPELSAVILSLVDEEGNPRQGFLHLHDIYNLELNADLVVLSACQTALGKVVRGEGLIALTRGFMYAGTPRVVATLWQVQDKAAAELMQRFYHRMLADGLPPGAALRQAQISMWRQDHWSAPYYWAGFTFQGVWGRRSMHEDRERRPARQVEVGPNRSRRCPSSQPQNRKESRHACWKWWRS